MNCPACSAAMTEEGYEGHYRSSVHVDVCTSCRGLWFDGHESIALAPAGVLALFGRLGRDAAPRPAAPMPAQLACPRCRRPLAPTSDLQRTTRFFYFRCPQGEGRFITFFQFLREKNFVQGLSPEQAAALRKQVQVVRCSSCGAPVDLDHGFACTYCGSAIEVLDPDQIRRTVEELQHASARAPVAGSAALATELAARLHMDRISTEARMADHSHDLVDLGLRHLFALWSERDASG